MSTSDNLAKIPTSKPEIAAALRRWAQGSLPVEAAVELLVRAWGGRLLNGSWIQVEPGAAWIDADSADGGYLSGGERRLLNIALSLADYDHTVCLNDVLPGLDRTALRLVIAATAHAAGAHYPWPERTT
jgi:hypothetical protein